MKKRNPLIFYILIIANFYILPFFVKDTGTAIVLLLVLMPIFDFIISLIYGMKIGFKIFYPILVAIIFLPTIFIYYNMTAWVYILIFSVIAVLGSLIGKGIKKRK